MWTIELPFTIFFQILITFFIFPKLLIIAIFDHSVLQLEKPLKMRYSFWTIYPTKKKRKGNELLCLLILTCRSHHWIRPYTTHGKQIRTNLPCLPSHLLQSISQITLCKPPNITVRSDLNGRKVVCMKSLCNHRERTNFGAEETKTNEQRIAPSV